MNERKPFGRECIARWKMQLDDRSREREREIHRCNNCSRRNCTGIHRREGVPSEERVRIDKFWKLRTARSTHKSGIVGHAGWSFSLISREEHPVARTRPASPSPFRVRMEIEIMPRPARTVSPWHAEQLRTRTPVPLLRAKNERRTSKPLRRSHAWASASRRAID